VHALHNYPPEFRGGVERCVEAATAAQRALGHDVRVVAGSETTAPAAERRDETHDGVRVHRLVRGPGLLDPIDPFRADHGPLYESVLEEFRPDVVHVHHWKNLGDDVARRAVLRGARVVVTLHDFHVSCALYFRIPDGRNLCALPQSGASCGACIDRALGVGEIEQVKLRVETRALAFAEELRAASIVTAPSAAHAAALRPHLPADVAVTPLSIGSAPSEPAPPRPRTGPLRVLHFGNLCRLKGVETLVDAIDVADPQGDGVALRLLGGVLEPDLRLGRATRLPAYDAEVLRREAADADVAVFPSFAAETYSLTVDEALRLGLPVIVSDRGAPAERVGERGIVVPAGDVGALAAVLRRLRDDPAALAALRAGRHASLETPSDFGRRAAELYERATASPPRPASLTALHHRRLAAYERTFGYFYDEIRRLRALLPEGS
jgi:glycosyltransferase involved in cell wall biosynthesis